MNTTAPTRQLLIFLPPLVVSCWLGMMLIHECGHMLAAAITGGTIQHLVFHPLAFSRTDVSPNPHPLLETWGGPLFGSLFPLALVTLLRAFRRPLFAAEIFAAFCLLANGAYLGIGAFGRVGDAGDLLRDGSPFWALELFGAAAIATGFILLHAQGSRCGFPTRIRRVDVWVTSVGALALVLAGFVIDGR